MSTKTESIKPAEIVSRSEPYLVPGKLKITEWSFRVPLQHSSSSNETLQLFGRSAEQAEPGHVHEKASSSKSTASKASSKPWMFYLQGGPGFGCSAPQDAPFTKYFLEKGYNVMLVDQRGTGQSSTISRRTLAERGSARDQAAYLKLFRADNIVRDVEAVRLALLGTSSSSSSSSKKNDSEDDTATDKAATDTDSDKRKITLLGQSFGGFCSTTYLSMFPDSLREVFMTGGLPPLGQDIDAVYAKLVAKAAERSEKFYQKFPGDVKVAREAFEWIKTQRREQSGNVETMGGGRLSEARLRAMGMNMGGHAGFTRMHNLLARLRRDVEKFGYWTRPTMTAFENDDSFDDAILYALVHEPIYMDGAGKAPNWAAERALLRSEHYGKAGGEHDIYFTAEMITHDTFGDHAELRPLLEVAEMLAADKEWPRLYDEEVLARNTVPTFCAVYHDDLYVDFEYSLATAKKIRGAKTFVTNRAYHDGLRSDTTKVLDTLFALRDDTMD